MIPATRAYFGVLFLGCTFYDSRDNTFDDDPDLSCGYSLLWYLYALISIPGIIALWLLIVIEAEGGDTVLEDL